MHETLRLGKVRGIAVGVNWSVLVIAALFAWSLADVTLPEVAPGAATFAYWLAGIGAAVIFFACLLAHELAHSVVAIRHGVEVDSITLWLLGGVSKLRGEAPEPGAELRIAAAGPATSVALAAAFGALAALAEVAGGPTLLIATLVWLAVVNGALAAFNLVPAAPLDGGRLLHALVWRRSGDHARATQVATTAGRWFGGALVALGVLSLFGGNPGGLWFVLLGWFLIMAARAEATHELLHGVLGSMPVRDVMTRDPVVVRDDVTVEELVDRWFLTHRCSAFPVVDDAGRTTGLVTLQRVRTTNRRSWPTLYVADIADDLASVARVRADDHLSTLLERVAEAPGGAGRALVLDGEHVVGIVSPTDLQRALEVLGMHRPGAQPPGVAPPEVPSAGAPPAPPAAGSGTPGASLRR